MPGWRAYKDRISIYRDSGGRRRRFTGWRNAKRRFVAQSAKLQSDRLLGIPSVYDRVCQQALANRLEPIFEKVFDPSSFGYRKGRKTADALTKIWREVEAGNEWIVDADLKDYFGSVDHEKLMTLIGKQIADSRVLILIQQMLKAGYEDK